MRGLLVLACSTFVMVVSGCMTPEPAAEVPVEVSTVPVNSTCPIMGGKVTAEGGSVVWNGQVVGFCCGECVPEWAQLSDLDKAAKLVAANQPHDDDDSGHDHEADQPNG